LRTLDKTIKTGPRAMEKGNNPTTKSAAPPATGTTTTGGGDGGGGKSEQHEDFRKTPLTQEEKEKLEPFIGQEWTGKCKWFNVTRGFGFIVPSEEHGGHDVFVHQSELQMPGFRSLDEGESVKFTVRVGKSGLEAASVTGFAEPLKGSSIRPLGKKKDKMIRCYKCGQLGYHVASKCKKEFETSKVCYFCHAGNHLLADCPDYKRKSERGNNKSKEGGGNDGGADDKKQ
jgi:protein lin-28